MMIWYVEDDASIRDIGMYALNAAGFETRGFEDGLVFWEALQKDVPDLIILDLMLPGLDGITILSKMKSSILLNKIPVILATAKGEEYDRVRGLDLGADDYIVKPFSIMEMVSRVRAVLRRAEPAKQSKILETDGLVLSLDEYTVTADGTRINLTHKEFELLRLFLTHPRMIYTREQLFNLVWNQTYIGESRTLDSHIRTLRQKLDKYGRRIETVRNVGYRWNEENE